MAHQPAEHQAGTRVDDAIRDTPEYRAAWDVELWKALQLKKLEKELKAKERQLMETAKQNAGLKEKQLVAAAERKNRELQGKEQKLVEDTILLERRRQKIVENEKDLKRRIAEVEDHRRRIELDADDRVRRVKEDGDHRAELINQRLEQASQATKAAEERCAHSQKEYLKLWEEFSDFKTKTVTQTGPHTHQLDAMRAQHSSELAQLTERSERRFKEATLQFQANTQHLHTEIRRLTQNNAHKKEQLRTIGDEASLLRQQREELARENDRLKVELKRAIDVCRQQQHDARVGNTHQQVGSGGVLADTTNTPQAAGNSDVNLLKASVNRMQAGGSSNVTPSVATAATKPEGQRASTSNNNNNSPPTSKEDEQVRKDLLRWKAERAALMRQSGGIYDAHSPVIVALDQRIYEATEQLKTPR